MAVDLTQRAATSSVQQGNTTAIAATTFHRSKTKSGKDHKAPPNRITSIRPQSIAPATPDHEVDGIES